MTFKVTLSQIDKTGNKQTINSSAYIVDENLYNKVLRILTFPQSEEIQKSIDEENANLTGRFAQPNKETSEEVQAVLEEQKKSRPRKYNYDVQVIKNLISDGKSDGEIAKLLQLPYQSLHLFVKKNGYRNMDTLI